ncbi:MAG: LacI family DNA-binding transcriptional regulator [Blastococcus sp.]
MTPPSVLGARRPGILDVARLAQVSPSTASRAIRGGAVSPDRRERVLRAAAELAYVPLQAAVRLSSGRTRTVGIVVPTADRWFFVEVVTAAAGVLRAAGYDLLIFDGGHAQPGGLPEAGELRSKVDAVVLVASSGSDDGMLALRELAVPAVVVGGPRDVPGRVGVDDESGAATAVRHLVLLGHREIAMISGGTGAAFDRTASHARRAGFCGALEAAGIPVGSAPIVSRPWGVAGGAAAMEEILSGERLPTAVFAESDEMAFGALQVLRRAGLDVPRDISVIGFDNHEMAAVFDLTTVAQPVADQGRAAATLLLGLLGQGGPPGPGGGVTLPTSLIVRGSVCPPKNEL